MPSFTTAAKKSEPDLSIYLFGQMEAILAGRIAVSLPSRRSMWLLAVLALHVGRPLERPALAGMLWPDSSDSSALHNLRQTLAGLRRALGPAGKLITSVSPRSLVMQCSKAIWIDVQEFDAKVKEMDLSLLEYALDLYRGPLLEGCNEPFAAEERCPRETLHLEGLERAASQYSLAGNPQRAIDYLRRTVAADPYRESATRALMTALAEAGEGAAALETYRVLRRRLRSDLKVLPDLQTAQLYQSIRLRISGQSEQARAEEGRRIPTPLNVIRGRKAEIREVKSLVERCRLVTLTGSAGVGKTRLAIAVAEQIKEPFLDGVRFVDLTSLQDCAKVPSTIAAALDIQEQPGRSPIQTLVEKLAELNLLIVLDNCEHLTEGVAQTLEALVTGSPTLHILATSRQSIGVVGELVWRVPSLSTPDTPPAESGSTAPNPTRREQLLTSDSVQLFLERTHWDSARREASPLSELEAIGSICRRLDGIPLAIELAASRINVLSPEQIEPRLEDRFNLLTRGSAIPARHTTLRAAIKWSWDLLTEQERNALMVLSVFRGGCTLHAIEAVLPTSSGMSSLDLIAGLVDRSLVVSNPHLTENRFSMLESIRQFAHEHLKESHREELALDRHRDFYLTWVEDGKSNLNGPFENLWFEQLEIEHDNLRAAIDWCHHRQQNYKALALALSLARFWDTHGHLSEGRERLEYMLTLVSNQPLTGIVAAVHLHVGWMATVQHDCSTAREHYERALLYYRETEDESAIAKSLICLGTAAFFAEDCNAAKQHFEEALTMFRKLGRQIGVATALNNLGEVALQRNDTAAAREYLELSIAARAGFKNKNAEDLGLTVCNLSLAAFRQAKYGEARDHIKTALLLFRDGSVVVAIPNALNMFAIVCAHFQDWERTARLLGASEGLSIAHSVPLNSFMKEERDAAYAATRRAIGQSRLSSAFDIGRLMSVDGSISLALEEKVVLR